MYPDLSYLLHDWFGTATDNWTSLFKTFGLLLAVAILSGAWVFHLELKRKAEEGHLKAQSLSRKTDSRPSALDLVLNGLLGFFAGYKLGYILMYPNAFQADAAAVLFSARGNWLFGLAGLLIVLLPGLWRHWQKRDEAVKMEQVHLFPHQRVGEITVIAAVAGIIGAKLFGVLEDPIAFAKYPLEMFFSGSGLAIYGGYIFGFGACYVYLRRNQMPPLHMLDAAVPALLLGYAVGRLGCHFSGDGDWGIANAMAVPSWWFLPDWLWAYDYPNNVTNQGILLEQCDPAKWQELLHNRRLNIEERCLRACGIRYCHVLQPPVFPTPIYESTICLLALFAFQRFRKMIQLPGMLFFLYLIFNGVERFFIEKIRVNITYESLPFQPTQAEIISILFFMIGVTGVVWIWLKAKKRPKLNQND